MNAPEHREESLLNSKMSALVTALELSERLEHLESAKKPRAPEPNSLREVPRGAWLYLAGFVSVGWAIGVYSGWSASPVVATLLPLLFALIGGASGLFLATTDLASSRTTL